MKLKDLLYVTTFGTKVVLFVFENGAMKPRIEFVVGEQPKEYDDFNIRSVDLIGDELHLRVSNKETAQEGSVQEQDTNFPVVIMNEFYDENRWLKRRFYVNGELIPNENILIMKDKPTITLADEIVDLGKIK